MEHLFSPQGMSQLATILGEHPLLALDFDGTLAPIVSRPCDASMSDGSAVQLDRLRSLLPIAIVTGRSVADVRERLGFEPAYIIGNHGAETQSDSMPRSGLDSAYAWIKANREALNKLGVEVEDKRLSIALHYRRAPHPAHAWNALRTMLSQLGPNVRVFGGQMVFNIVAKAAPDKALALRALVHRERATGAIFVSDDVHDVLRFGSSPPHWMLVTVGIPAPLPGSGAGVQFYLLNSHEVVSMLERMVALLGGDAIGNQQGLPAT